MPRAVADRLAETLSGYEFGEEVQRGGQAFVLRAVQRGTGRVVAVKVMRGGVLADSQHRARFEREVRILGQLRHPNIVTILDSGSSDGQFYYIMDYIRGQALDEYVRSGNLSVQQTAALFVKICDAVNAAHLRGIIHRDLKPQNIRVDPSGEPHVLDFGLAKVGEFDALADGQGDAPTMTGQFLGSVPWASPEQVEAAPEQIDVRTDVYSLGVMLYEALTGAFPYRVDGPLREALDAVCTAEPARPSIANGRIDDDLETIVLTCLRKSPDGRYQSAGELGGDLERYLGGEPIAAKRDNSWYMLRKTVRRHRVSVAIVGLVAALVATTAVGMTVLYRQKSRLYQQESRLHQQESRRRADAEEAARQAAGQVQVAQEINRFLSDNIMSSIQARFGEPDATVAGAIDAACENLSGRFAGSPLIEAGIRETVGMIYMDLGQWQTAIAHAERCLALRQSTLDRDAPEVLSAMILAGRLYRRLGRLDEAEAVLSEVLDSALATLGEEHDLTTKAMNNLAFVLRQLGRHRGAFEMNHRVLEIRLRTLGPDHEDTLTSMNNEGFYANSLGRLDLAADRYAHVYKVRRRLLGRQHPNTLISMHNLATIWSRLGRLDEAEALSTEHRGLARRVHGDRHDAMSDGAMLLGGIYRRQGRLDEAERLLTEALDIQRELAGEDHHKTATRLRELAGLYQEQGRLEDAQAAFEKALAICRRTVGDDHPKTFVVMASLGHFHAQRGDHAEAEQFLLDAHQGLSRRLGPDHPSTREAAGWLAALQEAADDPNHAVELRDAAADEAQRTPR